MSLDSSAEASKTSPRHLQEAMTLQDASGEPFGTHLDIMLDLIRCFETGRGEPFGTYLHIQLQRRRGAVRVRRPNPHFL